MLRENVALCIVLFFVCIGAIDVQDITQDDQNFVRTSFQDDACQDEENNATGVCTFLKDCPEALAGIPTQGIPQICGYEETVALICCLSITSTPAPTTKPETKAGEISLQKCKKYGESLYKKTVPSSISINEKPLIETICTLTVDVFEFDENANEKEFPHMALLGYGPKQNIKWQCGGTLISEQFVMTAGHCLHTPQDGLVRWIRLGDLNIGISTDDAQPQEFSVTQRIKHPQYAPPSWYNDIGLLKMDRPVKLSQYIRPACLYTGAELTPTERFLVTGWSLTRTGDFKNAGHLHKVIVDSFTQQQCNESYESYNNQNLKYGILPDSQLCAGGAFAKKQTCQGSSGGPLQLYSDVHCMYDIVGVTSFNKACGIVGVPGIYTRVSHYLDWIEKIVWH